MFQKRIVNLDVEEAFDPFSFRDDSGRCIKHRAFKDAVIKKRNFCFIWKGRVGN
jgi:hypothetical protein